MEIIILFFTVFLSVFIAEIGDKTQLSVFAFAIKNPKTKIIIFFASSLALITSSFIAIFLANTIHKYISPHVLNKISAIIFIILGIIILIKK